MIGSTAWKRKGSRFTIVVLGGLVAALALGARPATEPRGQRLSLDPAPWRAAIALMTGPAGPLARVRRLWQPDEGTRLIEAGDALRAGRGAAERGGVGLTPRTAYLLAFHHAQDAADTPRMLAAADRLQAVGDHELAHRLRAMAHGEAPGAPPARRSAR